MAGRGWPGAVFIVGAPSVPADPSASGVPGTLSTVSTTRSAAAAGRASRDGSRPTSTAPAHAPSRAGALLGNASPAQDDGGRRAEHPQVRAGVVVEHDQVGGRALVE